MLDDYMIESLDELDPEDFQETGNNKLFEKTFKDIAESIKKSSDDMKDLIHLGDYKSMSSISSKLSESISLIGFLTELYEKMENENLDEEAVEERLLQIKEKVQEVSWNDLKSHALKGAENKVKNSVVAEKVDDDDFEL